MGDCLHCISFVGMSMGIILIKLMDMGRSSLHWAAPFPDQEVMNCVLEIELSISKQAREQACIHFFLLLTVDVK